MTRAQAGGLAAIAVIVLVVGIWVVKAKRTTAAAHKKRLRQNPTSGLDRLDPQLLRQHRLVLPNLADRLGCLALKNSTTFSVLALTP
jgi:hypothetical protein